MISSNTGMRRGGGGFIKWNSIVTIERTTVSLKRNEFWKGVHGIVVCRCDSMIRLSYSNNWTWCADINTKSRSYSRLITWGEVQMWKIKEIAAVNEVHTVSSVRISLIKMDGDGWFEFLLFICHVLLLLKLCANGLDLIRLWLVHGA